MDEKVAWDDLRLFFHVAETGGLSATGRRTGLSAATIGRRMLALEQQAGQPLFYRALTGYSLTPVGQALLERVRVMQAAVVPVRELLAAQAETPLIRLSAGTATTMFLADRFNLLQRPGDGFRLNFVTTEAVLDIAHREIDLGIRNRPAETGNLASRPLGTLRFAPYRSYSVSRPDCWAGWRLIRPMPAIRRRIGCTGRATRSARWRVRPRRFTRWSGPARGSA